MKKLTILKILKALKPTKQIVFTAIITTGIITMGGVLVVQNHIEKLNTDFRAQETASIERASIISYNEGFSDCEDLDSIQFQKYKDKVKSLKAELKAEKNKPAKVVYQTKTVTAQADHSHCIPESDIVTMDTDKYDYYRVSIGDVNYKKYKSMCKRVNYTYADQEKDIAQNKLK